MENMQLPIKRLLYEKAARNHVPVGGTFELTPRCNFNCKMCYIRMSEQEMRRYGNEKSAEEWIAMGEACAEQGMLFLLLTGGEIFLRRDFLKIYEALAKKGLSIQLNTNGLLLNGEMQAALLETPPAVINVTLYGACDATYERLCGIKKGFTMVSENLVRAKEAGLKINLHASFTPDNVMDMDAMYAFAKEYDLHIEPASYMFPPVRNHKEGILEENVRFSAEEAGLARAKAVCLGNLPQHLFMLAERMQAAKKAETQVAPSLETMSKEQRHMACMAGRGSFWITWDGRMTPCGMMNGPAVHPFESGFADAWQRMTELTKEIYLPQECVRCHKREFCILCAALAGAESGGDTEIKPEYLCRMTDIYIDEILQYVKMKQGGMHDGN